MGVVPFQSFALTCELNPAPIEPDWIRSGTPTARNAILSRSADGSAYTMVWDCTAGSFEWVYDCDETVHILEGSILLSDAGNPVRRLKAGDAVFFPKGAVVNWQIEGYVRKLAFMRDVLPPPVSFGLKAVRRLRRMAGQAGARLKGAGAGARPVGGSVESPAA